MSHALRQAIQFHQHGRLGDAERIYRDVLKAQPRDFDALHMFGILKLQQGQASEAVRLFDDALRVDPRSSAAHCNRGVAFAALGRHDAALACFDQALAVDPSHAGAHASRADSLYDLKRLDEALVSYDLAVRFDPNLVSALVNRGVLLSDQGRLDAALASYDAAIAVEKNDAEAWNNRGVVLQELGRIDEALISHERALALRTDYVDAALNLANAQLIVRRFADAMAGYAKVLAQDPRCADAHYNLGNALFDLERFEEALASYAKAVAIRSNFFDARIGRARALAKLHRYDEASVEYETLRKLSPGLPNLLTDLIHCKVTTCHWTEMASLTGELFARVNAGNLSVDPFLFQGFDATPDQQFDCARNWVRLKNVKGTERTWNPTQFPSDRIRIAYLSADYQRHATTQLIAELFEIHDRDRFEIIGVSFGPDDKSQVRSRVIKSFDRFFDVTTQSDDSVAKLLRGVPVHIAVDLKGYTTNARMGIFSRRAAPIQVSYLGYPGTSGVDFMDYIVADQVVLPFDQQPFYSERIVQLPDSYQVNDSKRRIGVVPKRGVAGLPDRGFVFCCFNNSWKLNAPMFDVWMRILHRVEGSLLWLLRANAQVVRNLRAEAQARGIDPSRLVFAPQLDVEDHLARLTLADLFLDTLPYNAHTTASDALWSGVPVLTCQGGTFAGRVAASLLRSVGLPELVTSSLEDYEATAIRLATDPALLGSFRRRLQDNRATHPLFAADRFCRHIEAAYLRMWDIWKDGGGPQSFRVDPIVST